MGGNSFGNLFRLSTFGESHGKAIGGIIDGCPAGLPLDIGKIQTELSRRRPGQSRITTSRNEKDEFEILSGLYDDKTTGAPIGFIIKNRDYRPSDYNDVQQAYRPSHADFTYEAKYGIRDANGGGRSSARETASWVFAGAVARQLLDISCGLKITAYVSQIGEIVFDDFDKLINDKDVESSIVRCPDKRTSDEMIKLIEELKEKGDTVGGVISCVVQNVPIGLGEPVFNKLHADLGKAMLSINASHGFEYGSGFKGAATFGSQHNDKFIIEDKKVKTATNNSGGIQGGISNGMDICFRVVFKPVSTLLQQQDTINKSGEKVILNVKGRHDPCVVPRAVPIVEAMAALVLADHWLLNKTSRVS